MADIREDILVLADNLDDVSPGFWVLALRAIVKKHAADLDRMLRERKCLNLLADNGGTLAYADGGTRCTTMGLDGDLIETQSEDTCDAIERCFAKLEETHLRKDTA
jgi:phage terminase large subunit-like protein